MSSVNLSDGTTGIPVGQVVPLAPTPKPKDIQGRGSGWGHRAGAEAHQGLNNLGERVGTASERIGSAIEKHGDNIKGASESFGGKVETASERLGTAVEKHGDSVKSGSEAVGQRVHDAADIHGKHIQVASDKFGNKVNMASQTLGTSVERAAAMLGGATLAGAAVQAASTYQAGVVQAKATVHAGADISKAIRQLGTSTADLASALKRATESTSIDDVQRHADVTVERLFNQTYAITNAMCDDQGQVSAGDTTLPVRVHFIAVELTAEVLPIANILAINGAYQRFLTDKQGVSVQAVARVTPIGEGPIWSSFDAASQYAARIEHAHNARYFHLFLFFLNTRIESTSAVQAALRSSSTAMPAQTDLRFHMAVLGSKMQLVVPHDFGINVGGHLTHLRHHGSRSNLFGNGFTFAAAPSPPAVASESIDIARLEHQAMNARRKRDEWYEYCPDEAGMRYYLWWRFRGYREWSVAHSRVEALEKQIAQANQQIAEHTNRAIQENARQTARLATLPRIEPFRLPSFA